MSYLEAQVRGIHAKDKEISSDLTRLALDVHSTQRRARKEKSTPHVNQSENVKVEAQESNYAKKLEQMRAKFEAAAAERIESMKKSWQAEYCKLEDQHFDSLRKVEEELHNLRKNLHIAETELAVTGQNYKELKKAHESAKESSGDATLLKHTIEIKDSVISSLDHKLAESETQIFKLRKSLEDAITAMQRQHKENSELLRRLEKQQQPPSSDAATLENQIWAFGALIKAPLDSDFPTIVKLVEDALKDSHKTLKKLHKAENTAAELTTRVNQSIDTAPRLVEDLRETLAEVEAENEALKLQNSTLLSVKDSAQTVAHLEKQAQTMWNEKKALETELSALKNKLADSDQELEKVAQFETQMQLLQERLDEVENGKKALEAQNSILLTKSNEQLEEVAKTTELEAHIQRLQGKLDNIEKDRNATDVLLAKSNEETKESAKITQLEAQVQDLQDELANEKDEKSYLYLKSGEEQTREAARAVQFEADIQKAEREHKNLMDKLVEAETTIEALEVQNNGLLSAKSDKENEATETIFQLEAQVKRATLEAENLKDKLNKAESRQESVLVTKSDEDKISMKIAQLEEQVGDIQTLRNKLADVEAEKTTLEAQVRNMQNENDALRNSTLHLEDLKDRVADAEAERDTVQAQNELLRNACQKPTEESAGNLALETTIATVQEVTVACDTVTAQYHNRLKQLEKVAILCKTLQAEKQTIKPIEGGSQEVEELKRQNSSRIKVLKVQMGEINVQKNSFKKELDETRRENDSLKKEVQLLKG